MKFWKIDCSETKPLCYLWGSRHRNMQIMTNYMENLCHYLHASVSKVLTILACLYLLSVHTMPGVSYYTEIVLLSVKLNMGWNIF